MSTSAENTARGAILTAYRAHLTAMTDGDTNVLDDLLDDDFTLTHITDYPQAKGEWLAQMRSGQFRYHDVEERSTDVHVDGDAARLVGRVVTDATVYGTRADWRLQLVIDYVLRREVWTALRSVATTW